MMCVFCVAQRFLIATPVRAPTHAQAVKQATLSSKISKPVLIARAKLMAAFSAHLKQTVPLAKAPSLLSIVSAGVR